ncbi:hypothetical protein HC931_07640 [Candidatus Gracilibacteria bacterium]|nr:hypothetical protein [Candidatus Gracilibacteria bacterium]NJM89150.1 hypothetical protein [Hydrococcus sp. RU_2_2]NJP20973.1 hypothetical protein [Hydrococcus sp. CRU_1_1]NJQ97837.1 hypothetical protein [Hydrococcus sp. CSU_1_8]
MARWGEFVLVEYGKPSNTIYLDDDGILICENVAGDDFDANEGMLKEEYDPAYNGLVRTARFSR